MYTYTIGWTALNTVNSQPYLGVEINDTLDWSPHIHNIKSKANRLLGFLRKNRCKCTKNFMSTAYVSLVHPVTEHCSKVWNPLQIGLQTESEMVQRKVTRVVCNQPYRRGQSQRDSVTSIVKSLKWTPIESCETKCVLTLLYKTLNHLITIPLQYHLTQVQRSISTNHNLKLQHIHISSTIHKHSIYSRTIPI